MNVVEMKSGFPDAEIVSELIAVAKQTRTVIGLRLAELGLKTGEDDVLFAMDGREAVSATELSTTLFVRFPTMVQVIDGLVERGFLTRVAGPIVRLSDTGKMAAEGAVGIRSKLAGELNASLGVDHLAEVRAVLRDLNGSLGTLIRALT